jgi:hypothetical protein
VTALTNERMSSQESWQSHLFTLASGNKAWKNGVAAIDLGSGKVVPASTRTDLFVIGKFTETVDASAADKLVNVRLAREIWVEWLNNDASSIASTDLGALCYLKDDQSVTITPTGASIADASGASTAVAASRLSSWMPSPMALHRSMVWWPRRLRSARSLQTTSNLGATPHSGAMYEVPATAAASTITLPATADEGTVLYFLANGTDNAHTVQYRDATGPTNITTALTASKRHMVIAAFLNGAWRANAYVSP